MSLSDKEHYVDSTDLKEPHYYHSDVKESIKRILAVLCSEMIARPKLNNSSLDRIPQREIMNVIKEEFGEKLI